MGGVEPDAGFILSLFGRNFSELRPLLVNVASAGAPAIVGLNANGYRQCMRMDAKSVQCVLLPQGTYTYDSKFLVRLLSPFTYNLQIDADTRLCGSPSSILWQVRHMLQHADFLARRVDTRTYGPKSNVVPRFDVLFKPQGGVLAWRWSPELDAAWRAALKLYDDTRLHRHRACDPRSVMFRLRRRHCRGSEQDALAIALREHSRNISIGYLPRSWNCKEKGRELVHCCSGGCLIDHHCRETMQH